MYNEFSTFAVPADFRLNFYKYNATAENFFPDSE